MKNNKNEKFNTKCLIYFNYVTKNTTLFDVFIALALLRLCSLN